MEFLAVQTADGRVKDVSLIEAMSVQSATREAMARRWFGHEMTLLEAPDLDVVTVILPSSFEVVALPRRVDGPVVDCGEALLRLEGRDAH